MNDFNFNTPFDCIPLERFLVLERFDNSKYGTFGRLLWNDDVIMFTLEPNNLDGKYRHAIKEGTYTFDKRYSQKFGKQMYYLNVPNRSGIMIHAGNKASDTKGCILVGSRYDKFGIYDSKSALADLMDFLKYAPNVRYIRVYHSWVDLDKNLFNYDRI